MTSKEYLVSLMDRYKTDELIGISPAGFKKQIDKFLAMNDYKMECYDSPEAQRDHTIKFNWGHNHDFGTFKLPGMMEDRHIEILSEFIDVKVLEENLYKEEIVEIGCWTGGMSLLLAAMGAQVCAIEEVVKYCQCVRFLSESFKAGIEVYNISLYEMECRQIDKIFLCGVLYHLSDPIVALRKCYDTLRPYGRLYLETLFYNTDFKVCRYMGPSVVASGSKEKMNRTGWNWFAPSIPALVQMCEDVGFEDIRTKIIGTNRVILWATKKEEKPMCMAGMNC